jgi:glycosyltransferase involved in cell wall biosynthesis
LPLVRGRPSFLRFLPMGLARSVAHSIVHFPQIMGSAQMLWRPVHPAIATVHDLGRLVCPEDEALWTWKDRWILDLQLRGLKQMDWWVVNSEQTRRHLVEHLGLPRERITWVQLGVDSTFFRPLTDFEKVVHRELGLVKLPGTTDLLYVGGEFPRKGLLYLVKALSLLKAKGHRFRLIKVGSGGKWRALLEEQIKAAGIEQHVTFVGYIADEILPYLYNFADVYVTPTLLEGGFTWTAMEAMACGKPVVGTTSALVREEVKSAALIVPNRDSRELAGALSHLIVSEELRTEMGARARLLIEPFSWSRTIYSMVQVYRHVAMGDLSRPLILDACAG